MQFSKKLLNLNFLLWFFFYLAIFSFVLSVSFDYFDHDFPWHLRIGEQISKEAAAPSVDYYNHTMFGKEFIDHEWLFNWIFFKLYDNFGYISLNIFFATTIVLTLFLLKIFTERFFINNHAKHMNHCPLIIMALSVFGAYSMLPFYGVRMQILGNLFFLIMLFLLELWNQKKEKKFLFWLLPLFVVWTNLHGSFLIGLTILWGYMLCKLTVLILNKLCINIFELNNFEFKDFAFGALIAVLASLVTLINPYGLDLYSFLKTYSNSYYMTAILEWRPFYYLPIYYNQIILMAIFVAILILSIFLYQKKNKNNFGLSKYVEKINLWQWSLAILFFLLALKSKRNFPLFFIASFPLLIQFTYFELFVEIKNKFAHNTIRLFKILLVLLFLIFSIFTLSKINFVNDPFNKEYSPSMPYDLLSYLKTIPNLEDKKIFNDYSWGGFFLWTLPEAKIFIDGRMPQANFAGHSLIEEYMDFYNKGRAEELINKHKIDLIILQKEVPVSINSFEEKFFKLNEEDINSTPNYLEEYLQMNKDWLLVYSDELGEIYLKQ